jgi:formylglycine-generating enzyme required for sulfatase activity
MNLAAQRALPVIGFATMILLTAPAALGQCNADLDSNGIVNGADLGGLLTQWGTNGPEGDLDNNGVVNGADLGLMLTAWGPCGPVVPSWATLLQAAPDPAIVTDSALRQSIVDSNWAWRVLDTATGIEMVLIPAGTFWMGCSQIPGWGCFMDELPLHEVTLSQPFYIGRYEVTQSQWTAAMGSNPSHFSSFADSPQRPVERVNWTMAQAFVTSIGMQLPTEAQWEYAARAGTTTAFHGIPSVPEGSDQESYLVEISWVGANSGMQTKPFGLKPPNGFGLHDMCGNVLEWCRDWYGQYPEGPVVDPVGPSSAWGRVFRGGCWHLFPLLSRVAVRYEELENGDLYSDTGLRVIRTP